MKKILEQLKSSEFGTKNRAKRILLVEELEEALRLSYEKGLDDGYKIAERLYKKETLDLQIKLSAHQSNYDQLKIMYDSKLREEQQDDRLELSTKTKIPLHKPLILTKENGRYGYKILDKII
jgi:hypothetical protein